MFVLVTPVPPGPGIEPGAWEVLNEYLVSGGCLHPNTTNPRAISLPYLGDTSFQVKGPPLESNDLGATLISCVTWADYLRSLCFQIMSTLSSELL